MLHLPFYYFSVGPFYVVMQMHWVNMIVKIKKHKTVAGDKVEHVSVYVENVKVEWA